MFARVSTYETSADTQQAPSEDTVRQVLEITGCRGIYFLNSNEGGKALSITLWDTADALTASHAAANAIRSATSKEQGMQIVSVEEFEVTTNALTD